MKIHGTLTSPFVRSTLVAAHELGLGNRITHVSEQVSPTEANPKLKALSPIGKVPVLETDHAHAIHDSRVILEYLCHVAGNSDLIPDDGVKRFKVLTLQALGQGLGDAAVSLRYETATRPKGLQWAEWMERTKLRITAVFDDLEANWQGSLDSVNAGSITVAVVLAYIDFRMPEFGWRKGRPKLASFHEKFSKRESMVKTALAA
ncbi:MAG: glutathione S-transferase family protein [Rhizobiales bacterium]|nr:glutathione S-transferase family protein [Hyphomicrobiales bacterium]